MPTRGPGVQAATRRFPKWEAQIVSLAASSESFFDLCDDLAEAERALAAVETTPLELRDERKAEWRTWVAILSEEIERALTGGRVVSMFGRRAKSDPDRSRPGPDRNS